MFVYYYPQMRLVVNALLRLR